MTADVRKFIEDNYLPALRARRWHAGRLGRAPREALDELRPKDRDRVLFDAVGKVLRRKFSAPNAPSIRHLVEGGPTDPTQGGQRVLVEAMKTTFDVEDWRLNAGCGDPSREAVPSRGRPRAAGRRLPGSNPDRRAVARAGVSLFGYLLGSDNQRLDDVAASVRKQWGPGLRSVDPKALEAIEPELTDASGEHESARRWVAIARALAYGDYARPSSTSSIRTAK